MGLDFYHDIDWDAVRVELGRLLSEIELEIHQWQKINSEWIFHMYPPPENKGRMCVGVVFSLDPSHPKLKRRVFANHHIEMTNEEKVVVGKFIGQVAEKLQLRVYGDRFNLIHRDSLIYNFKVADYRSFKR